MNRRSSRAAARERYTQASPSCRVDMRRDFRDWLKPRIYLLARHDDHLKAHCGPPAFLLTKGRYAWAWVFDLGEGTILYVFTGTRGTSFEYCGPYNFALITAKILAVFPTPIAFPSGASRGRLNAE